MIKTTKDGRTIRTGKDYTEFRGLVWTTQGGHCAKCARFTFLSHPLEWDSSFHNHHKNGRGGGKRDDTLEACTGLCGKCHREEHGQQ